MELHISVKDEKAELFLQILKEFKNDMIETFNVLPSNYVSDEEQKEIEKILNSIPPKEREIDHSKIVEIDI